MLVPSEENYMKRNKFLLDPEQYSRYGLNNLMQLPHRFLNSLYSTFFSEDWSKIVEEELHENKKVQ